jgi:hypothetical protein
MKKESPLSELDRKVLSRLRRGRCSSYELRVLLEHPSLAESVKVKMRAELAKLDALPKTWQL